MLGAFLLFGGLPVALALVLGFLVPSKAVLMGIVPLGGLALLLFAVNARHGVVAMIPFTAFMMALLAIPAILAALLGSVAREKMMEKK